jgi:tRNA-2-methylthio-N6-dimethylallyladenosine synthase
MFVYSPRRGTPAALWEQIPESVGGERLRRLAETANAGMRVRHDAMRGQVVRALVTGPSRRDPSKLAAKTTGNVTVIAPRGSLDDATLVARPWLDVRVDEAFVWGCTGRLVGAAERYTGPALAVDARETIDLIPVR